MGLLDEFSKKENGSVNGANTQTPAEQLEALRPTQPIPPRVIIHSYEPGSQGNQKQTEKMINSVEDEN